MIKQHPNSGIVCTCGSYMYANEYKKEIVCICPLCGNVIHLPKEENEKMEE